MGDPITGRELIIGLKKAATWGTAVACGASDGVLILSESIKQAIEELPDDSLGAYFHHQTDKGKRNVSGNLEAYMRYEGIDLALALIMGTAGAPSQQGLTAAYTNSYVMANEIYGLFATLAMLKKSNVVHEYPSIKLHGFTLSGEMYAPMKLTLNALPDKLVTDSVTNTSATMANVTYPDKSNRIIMNSDTTFKINDKSGAAVGDGDKVYPASFELNFNRPLEGDIVVGADGIDEPIGTGFPEATLKFSFPKYNDENHAFFADWEAFTEKKMEIYLKGILIEATYYYDFKIIMPNLKVTDVDTPAGGPGKIPNSITFRLLGTDTAPTGMTGITKPFQIDITNKRTTDPLA